MRITALLALAAGLLADGSAAQGQTPAGMPAAAAAPAASASAAAVAAVQAAPAAPAASGTALQPSTTLQHLPSGDAARQLPIVLQADSIRSQLDLETVAEGKVDFRRGGTIIRADRVAYDAAQDLASAKGHVRISRDGAIYSGPELQLRVQRFEGFFLQPEFQFPLLGAGGRAERIDFLDNARSLATTAEYTSCPRDTPQEPAWLLRADSVSIDQDTNEGVAKGAVLRFLHVPIIALPSLSFPLSDARKSGWLPPSVSTDNRNGVELSIPYYWNIAPNRDATITPRVLSRRGFALDTEVRYLAPRLQGTAIINWLPDDRVTGGARNAWQWTHDGRLDDDVRYNVDVARVSDNAWWKDFPNASRSLTPRLLAGRLGIQKPFSWSLGSGGEGLAYARATRWQVLQDSDSPIVSPYGRSPQIGLRLRGGRDASRGSVGSSPAASPGGGDNGIASFTDLAAIGRGWDYAVETEYNHFTLPGDGLARAGRNGGDRLHLLANLSRPLREPGWFVVPKLSVNAAAYNEGSVQGNLNSGRSRSIPSFSLDTGLELERSTEVFNRAVQQTLEPRLLYVRTPYRRQSQFPNYDSAAKDFNFSSIYSDNQFSGVDRVNDANQLTAGVTTRFVDSASGAEALRLGLVQRYLFRTQQVTAQSDGTPDGAPIDQRFSDLLLLASTSVIKSWTLDSALEYSPEIQRSVRSIVGVRYAPGPLRTVSATYRLARGLSEQLELGWQWPIYGRERYGEGSSGGNASSCGGGWYSVGRVNYSLRDSRITDSIIGLEYDAGCWIGRVVSERLSTGRSQATTRLMVQLELVGLSRIGSNPLKVLKDNIPGYRLLREERRGASANDDQTIAPFYD